MEVDNIPESDQHTFQQQGPATSNDEQGPATFNDEQGSAASNDEQGSVTSNDEQGLRSHIPAAEYYGALNKILDECDQQMETCIEGAIKMREQCAELEVELALLKAAPDWRLKLDEIKQLHADREEYFKKYDYILNPQQESGDDADGGSDKESSDA